jgi:hypothetical protein
MNKLLYECILIGLLTTILVFIINHIIEYQNKKNKPISCIASCVNKYNSNNKNKNLYYYFIIFLIGVFIHLIIDYIGLNDMYCKKECYDNGKCEYVCRIPIKN